MQTSSREMHRLGYRRASYRVQLIASDIKFGQIYTRGRINHVPSGKEDWFGAQQLADAAAPHTSMPSRAN